MYSCDICDKSFVSNKKYKSHLERCKERSDNNSFRYPLRHRSSLDEITHRRKIKPRKESYKKSNKYKRTIELLTEESNNHRGVIQEKEELILNLTREKDSLIEDLNNIQEIKTKLKKQYAKKLAKIKLENNQLKHDLDTHTHESSVKYNSLKDSFDEVNNLHETTKEQLLKVKTELQSTHLKSQKTLKELNDKLDRSLLDNKSMTDQLSERLNNTVTREKKLKEHNKAIVQNLQKQIEKMKANHAEEIKTLNDRIYTIIAQNEKHAEETKKTITVLELKEKNMTTHSKEQCIKHINERNILKDKNKQVLNANFTLAKEISRKDKLLNEHMKAQKILEEENNKIKNTNSVLTRKVVENDKLLHEHIKKTHAIISSQQSEIKKYDVNVNQLKKELENRSQQAQQELIDKLKDIKTRFDVDMAKKTEQLEKYRERQLLLQEHISKQDRSNRELQDNLNSDLQTKTEQINMLNNTQKEIKKANVQLAQRIKQLDLEIAESNKKLLDANEDRSIFVKGYEDRIKDLTENNSQLKISHNQTVKEYRKINSNLTEKYRENAKQQENKIKEILRVKKHIQQKLENITDNNGKLQQTVKNLESHYTKEIKKLNETHVTLRIENQKLGVLIKSCSDEKSTMERLKNENKKYTDKIKSLLESIQRLDDQNIKIKAEFESMKIGFGSTLNNQLKHNKNLEQELSENKIKLTYFKDMCRSLQEDLNKTSAKVLYHTEAKTKVISQTTKETKKLKQVVSELEERIKQHDENFRRVSNIYNLRLKEKELELGVMKNEMDKARLAKK